MEIFKKKIIALRNAVTDPLILTELNEKNCKADVLRLDQIHPVISGNKWFKLKYHLEDALEKGYETILTFGGAYSNHIVATAFAAREAGLKSIGVIRGEAPAKFSHTLKAVAEYGMQLEFISRSAYKSKDQNNPLLCRQHVFENSGNNLLKGAPESGYEINYKTIINKYNNPYIIPEGGASEAGRKGCKEILLLTDFRKYSHILCAIGTGTMYLGLVNASVPGQRLIGIPVLKGMTNLLDKYGDFIKEPELKLNCTIFYEYSFGGYAKKTKELIEFINSFFGQTGIPTDFVYTGKLIYAFMDLIKKDFFPPESNILLIHSGGLQGNLSLPDGTLIF